MIERPRKMLRGAGEKNSGRIEAAARTGRAGTYGRHMKTIGKIFLLFTIVTTVELFLLLELARYTSWWVSVATIVVPGIVGAWLLKREGAKALRAVTEAVSLQREPAEAILDGLLVLVASVLLITPGVLSDLTGLALLVPAIRAVARDLIRRRVRLMIDSRLSQGSFHVSTFNGFGGAPFGGRHGGEVIDAEDIPKPGR